MKARNTVYAIRTRGEWAALRRSQYRLAGMHRVGLSQRLTLSATSQTFAYGSPEATVASTRMGVRACGAPLVTISDTANTKWSFAVRKLCDVLQVTASASLDTHAVAV